MYIGRQNSVVRVEHQLGLAWLRLKVWVVSHLVSLLRASWRVRLHGREVLTAAIDRGGAVIAFWHGEQLPLVPLHANTRIAGLASLSADGALLAGVIDRLGYSVVRGSSSQGGAAAFEACMAALEAKMSPALAVDGPRGPRHRVHTGAVRLSQATGASIVIMASHAHRAWQLQSWDGFQIPLPGSRVDVAYGEIPASALEGSSVDEGCRKLRDELLKLGAQLRRSPYVPLVG